jgi:hypothetical protein
MMFGKIVKEGELDSLLEMIFLFIRILNGFLVRSV